MAEQQHAVGGIDLVGAIQAGTSDYALGDPDENLTDYGNDVDQTGAPESAEPAAPAGEQQPAPEPESTPEPASEPAPEPEQEPAPEPEQEHRKPEFIPKPRFNEVNERKKQLERENAELKARLAAAEAGPKEPTAAAFDFDAAEAKYMEAVLDGDKEKALVIRREIRSEEKKALETEVVAPRTEAARRGATVDVRVEAVVAQINAEFPVFDPQSESYDPDMTDEAVALARTYQARGESFDKALRRAVDKVVKANELAPAPASEPAPAPKPEPKAAPKPSPEQLKAKVEAAGKQPPKPNERVPNEPAKDIDSMTQEEYDALPEATKARMRGDYI